ncbi:hypothetical protein J7L01_00730 [bacterium]|nr:hypothetical protein [bacterium]
MAEIKTRNPRDLSDENYDEWFTRWVTWFLAFPDTVENANWLRADLNLFDADFHDKRIAAMEAKNAQDAATKAWNTAVVALRELLVKLRISLPTLTPGDDSVLDTLVLRGEVPPMDVDSLLDYAELVDNAWQPLSGDPLYAPFAGRLNLIAPNIADVQAKRIVMGQAILDYSTATDEKTAAREVCNTRERAVFNFFRGEGKDSTFWTSSPHGMPSGGESEHGGEETPWPGPVEGLEVVIDPIGNILIDWKNVATAVKYDLLREMAPIGDPAPVLPYSTYKTGIPPMEDKGSFTDTDFDPGFAYYYSIVAYDENNLPTEPCEPVSIKIM